ncbi:MAG TPA: VWA domain-containing protein, partial [Desulfobulbaceae bacterium]|nr:VWA domain-containing protein [Desulfobulbaceae bacterium]
MRKERRSIDVFSLSFLDVISCGFGAIILLLVLSKVSEPLVRERVSRDWRGEVQTLKQQLVEIRDNSKAVNRELALSNRQLEDLRQELVQKQQEIAVLKAQYQTSNLD